MNVIMMNGLFIIHSGNGGILKGRSLRVENCNALWGPEYIIMGGKHFIENNANDIIEIMVKAKAALLP